MRLQNNPSIYFHIAVVAVSSVLSVIFHFWFEIRQFYKVHLNNAWQKYVVRLLLKLKPQFHHLIVMNHLIVMDRTVTHVILRIAAAEIYLNIR